MSFVELARRLFRKSAHRCALSQREFHRARLTVTALEDRITPVSGPTNLVAAGISDAFEAVSSGTDGIIRISGNSGTLPATLNLSYGGTAVNGVDYSAPTTFVFPSKASYVDIPITPIHNSTATGTLTVSLTIGLGASYTIGTQPTDSVKVYDIDNPQVTVAVQGGNPTEGGNGTFRISRTGSTSGNLTVNFSVGGTATSGTDFTSIGTSATITSGNNYVDVTVPTLADNVVESGGETVSITLADGGSSYTALPSANASLTISDDPPTIFMNPVNFYEDGNPASMMFLRAGGNLAASLSVSYSAGGTATAGTDYTALSGTVVFAAGSSVAFVEIEPIADTDDEGNENLTLTIAPGSTYIVVAPGVLSAMATLVIIDDDAPGDISGTAWLDDDENGSFDDGESAAAGITVELLDENGDPVLDGSSDPIQTTTDVDGEYGFADVAAGSYQLRFTAPSGMVLVGDDDTWTQSLTVDSFQAAVVNLPVYDDEQTGSISGFVWDYIDGDGFQSGFEPGLESVDVVIRDGGENIVGSTATDSDGHYEVAGLAPGTYSVEFTVTGDYLLAESKAAVWETSAATPGPASTRDAAAYLLSQIDGVIWVDADGDGEMDGGESKLAGVVISLLDSNGDPVLDGNDDPIQATTDAYGAYVLADLIPGEYQIEFAAPSGYVFVGDSDALTLDAGAFSGQANTIDRPAYSDSASTSITGLVWLDLDGNGTWDDGESGLEDVGVVIKDGNDDVVGTATTDGSGAFSVGSLDPGTYTVEFMAPEDYLMIATARATSSASVSTPGSSSISAGAFEPTLISGTVWIDVDNDGVRDGGEDRLANVLVIATDDMGQVAFADTTDGDGEYTMPNLRPGRYQITFSAPSGYHLNGTASTITVTGTLASGDSAVIDRPAYDDEQLGAISGSVWEDTDADGVKDGGESFLSGVLVELLDSDGDPVLDEFDDPIQVTTTSDGLYSFTDLEAGLYIVRFTAPSGYVMVSSHDLATTRTIITPGTETTADEGAFQPDDFVSGSVWLDEADWDGEWGGGESGLAGVVVALTDLGGGTVLDLNSDPVSPVTTNAYGAFAFPAVAPGTYLVTMTAPSGYALEGSGIPVWKGRFTVGTDSALQVGAYEQEAVQNQPAVPEPAPAPRVYDSVFKLVNTNTWLTTPPALRPTIGDAVNKWDQAYLPTDYQYRQAITIEFPDLSKFAPPGTKYLTPDAQVYLTVARGTILTDRQITLISESIQTKLKEEYGAILRKQDLFKKIGGKDHPAPNYEDLMQMVQAIPRGLFAAGVTGVQARLDGGLANWVFHTGLGIDPGKLSAKGIVDFRLNPNWDNIKEVTGGLKISYGSDRMIFTPSVAFDSKGFSKAMLNFEINW